MRSKTFEKEYSLYALKKAINELMYHKFTEKEKEELKEREDELRIFNNVRAKQWKI